MTDVDPILLVSRWLHLLAAITAIGGAMFMRFALQPAARDALEDAAHERLREAVRRRWAKFVHGSIAILLITGGYNFVVMALPPKIDALPYHPIFGLKFLLALCVFVIATALAGRSPAFEPVRRDSRRWLGTLIALAAAIVLVSGVLNQVRTGSAARRAAATAAPANPAGPRSD